MTTSTTAAMASTEEVGRTIDFFTLPAEIRNQIYALVVVEDEPVIAYIDEKPIRRSQDTDEKEGRLSSKTITYPTLPEIACACRRTYQEATPVFFSKYTFIFSEKSLCTGSFMMWQSNMTIRHYRYMTLNLRRMIVEFPVLDLAQRRGEKHAEIEGNLSHDGQIEVRFGGALPERCICNLLVHLNQTNAQTLAKQGSHQWSRDTLWRNNLLDYVFRSEHLRKNLNRSGSIVTECTKCSKPSSEAWRLYGSETNDTL